MKTKKKIQAYWFGNQLRYGDGRIPRKGRTHRVKGHPRLCNHGLHASINPLDALEYSDCNRLWMVELSGEVIKGEDKLVATERTYIRSIDAQAVVRKFARWCAMRAAKNYGIWLDMAAVAYQYLLHGREEDRVKVMTLGMSRFTGNSAARAAWYAADDNPRDAALRAAAQARLSTLQWGKENQAQRRKFKKLVEEAFANAS